MRVGRWSATAAQNAQSSPDGAPEGWSPTEVNNWGRETMAAVKTLSLAPEWIDLISTPAGSWPTIVRDSDTQITIQGTDFTAAMQAGRRIRIVGATTAEGFIASSALDGSDTEVVITFDSGVCPTSPTEAWVGPASLGKAAWFDTGAGSGLDADTVDGQHASALSSNIGKNRVIDGRFSLWDAGASFSDPAGTYTASMHRSSVGGSGAGTISRQAFTAGQTDVPFEPTYFYRHNQTSNGTNPHYRHRIEDVRTFAGEEALFSLYMKAGGSENVTMRVSQNFGSGGSTEVEVDTQAETLTTGWVRYSLAVTMPSVAGKTIGASSYIELEVELPSGSSFTIDLADVQFELGSSASDIDQRPLAFERAIAARFYQRIAEADGEDLIGTGLAVAGDATGLFECSYQLGPMRTTPNVTLSAASTFGWGGSESAFSANAGSVAAHHVGPSRLSLRMERSSGTHSAQNALVGGFVSGQSGYIELDARL